MDWSYAAIRLGQDVCKPSNFLLLVLVSGISCLLLGRLRPAKLLLGGVGLVLVAVSILPLDQWLLLPLEQRFPAPSQPPARVDGIIVLGGAIKPRLSVEWGQPALNEHAERMLVLPGLARRYPDAKLVFTGGSAEVWPQGGGTTEASIARVLFEDMGLDVGRMLFEDRSRNTYENAVRTMAALHPAPDETWLLVTSAFHMPRAVGVFRSAGWRVVPWPVDYISLRGPEIGPPMLPRSLVNLDLAFHEWIGLVGYRLMGRIDTLLPDR